VRQVGNLDNQRRLGTAPRSLAWALTTVCALGLAGCPATTIDLARSNTRLDLAKDFVTKHDLENAESECNRALALNPHNEEAFLVRGLVAMLRAYDTQRLLEIDGCLTGIDAEAMSRDLETFLKKADTDFKAATAIAPDYSEAWSNRGAVANLVEDPEAAIGYLQHALENPVRLANPGLTRSHLGWSYFKKGDAVSAAKELLNAVQFQPGMCVASYRLGRVYFLRKEWEKAAELFTRVVEADESADIAQRCNSQEARLYLMKVRLQQGLIDDAKQAQSACLTLSPKSCIAVQCRTTGVGSAP
jgi:tetratricopeptide (TPR) repeat protein